MTDGHLALILHIATSAILENLSAAVNSTICCINLVSVDSESYNVDSYPFVDFKDT